MGIVRLPPTLGSVRREEKRPEETRVLVRCRQGVPRELLLEGSRPGIVEQQRPRSRRRYSRGRCHASSCSGGSFSPYYEQDNCKSQD